MNKKIEVYLNTLHREHVPFDEMERVDINTVGFLGPPLHFAIGKDNYEIAKLLLENGADPDLKDSEGYTSLDEAIELSNIRMISLLLRHNATLNVMDDEDLNKAMSQIK